MLEFLLCSLFTILPDFLVRRYVQGKRWGQELNFFSVWYELRWGMSRLLLKFVQQALLVEQATQPWPSVQGRG